jgi:hypothetical protein
MCHIILPTDRCAVAGTTAAFSIYSVSRGWGGSLPLCIRDFPPTPEPRIILPTHLYTPRPTSHHYPDKEQNASKWAKDRRAPMAVWKSASPSLLSLRDRCCVAVSRGLLLLLPLIITTSFPSPHLSHHHSFLTTASISHPPPHPAHPYVVSYITTSPHIASTTVTSPALNISSNTLKPDKKRMKERNRE